MGPGCSAICPEQRQIYNHQFYSRYLNSYQEYSTCSEHDCVAQHRGLAVGADGHGRPLGDALHVQHLVCAAGSAPGNRARHGAEGQSIAINTRTCTFAAPLFWQTSPALWARESPRPPLHPRPRTPRGADVPRVDRQSGGQRAKIHIIHVLKAESHRHTASGRGVDAKPLLILLVHVREEGHVGEIEVYVAHVAQCPAGCRYQAVQFGEEAPQLLLAYARWRAQ